MTAGPTPRAAARGLRSVLQQAVSCISTGVLVDDPSMVTSELRLTSRLARRTGGHIVLVIKHRYSLIADAAREDRARWRAQTVGDVYALDDTDGREIVGCHWHPIGHSHVTTPHLHLGVGAGPLRPELVKAHLETGFVTPVAVLTLLLEQFDVRPRRADWIAVLERARRALDPA